MSDKPAVLLDTSTLRGTSLDGAPFRTLLELAKADLVDIFIPEVAAEERRTQWRDSRADGLCAGQEALEALLADPLLTEAHRGAVKAALDATKRINIEEVSKDAYDEWMKSNRITKVPLSVQQAQAAWSSYFSGSPPHRKVKSREDIPDAHIFAAAREIVAHHKPLHCVSSDKGLATALEAVPDTTLFGSIEELLQAKPFIAARAHSERDQVWQALVHKVPFDVLKQEVRDLVEGSGGDFLETHDVTDDKIPGPLNSAEIGWAAAVEVGEVSNHDDWGGGLLSYEVSFECEASVGFLVRRSDVPILPNWIKVERADPEITWLDAQGFVRLSVEAVVTAQVDLSTAEGGAPKFSDWTLEPKHISVLETE